MIALGLLAGVLITISGLFVVGAKQVKSGRTSSEALAVAKDIHEDMYGWGYSQLWGMFGYDGQATTYTVDTRACSACGSWQSTLAAKLGPSAYADIRLDSVAERRRGGRPLRRRRREHPGQDRSRERHRALGRGPRPRARGHGRDDEELMRPGKPGQRGMSLIEVLVASAILSVAIVMALTVYDASRKAFARGENATEQQESVRIAFDMITSDIRTLGLNVNPDGDPGRPDEQLEGALDHAVILRADFDGSDATASQTPETSLAGGAFHTVSTGNDEIVAYVLSKPDGTGPDTITFQADVRERRRDGDVEPIAIDNVVLDPTAPPYTLYRVTLNNDRRKYGGASFIVRTPVVENVRDLSFVYQGAGGTFKDAVGHDSRGCSGQSGEGRTDAHQRVARGDDAAAGSELQRRDGYRGAAPQEVRAEGRRDAAKHALQGDAGPQRRRDAADEAGDADVDSRSLRGADRVVGR